MDEGLIQQQFDDDWIDYIYHEGDIKITRYKPSWYKSPESYMGYTIKGSPRKPTFGSKDP